MALASVYEHWLARDLEAAWDVLTTVTENVRTADEPWRDELASYAASAYAMLGAFETAEDLLQVVGNEQQRKMYRALIASVRGDPQADLEDVSPYNGAMLGDVGLALTYLEHPPAVPALIAESRLQLVRGRVALVRGDTAAAIPLLEAGVEGARAAAVMLIGAEVLARAWLQHGDPVHALRTLEEASELRSQLFTGPALSAAFWLRIEAERARLVRALGRDDEAAEIETQLLQLLSRADDDHQILRDLRARQAAPHPVTPSAN